MCKSFFKSQQELLYLLTFFCPEQDTWPTQNVGDGETDSTYFMRGATSHVAKRLVTEWLMNYEH